MPAKGQILINPVSGDTFEFIETAHDTNGERVTVKSTIKSRGRLVPDHLHTLQDESFEVLSGELTFVADSQLKTVLPGQRILLPKNTAHNHFNLGQAPLTYIHTTSPALDFEYLLETLVGLASDGKIKNGKAGLVQELVILKYLDSKAYLAGIPVGIQKVLMHLVAPAGRLFGYRAIYKKYSGMEK